MPDILLVEDKDSLRRVLRLTLEHAGYSVTECADARAAAAEIARAPYRLVLTDLRMPHGSGLDVLHAARAADPDVPVVVMTAYGSIDEAVQAMKDGAHDFLQKPVDSNHLLLLIGRALEQARLRTENILLREEWSRRYGFPRIIGESDAIKRAVAETQRVATTEATVLLLGESGTGKELFARAVHHLSHRRDQPFVAINCAAIPETLIESELFGHERGAFTGATERRPGKFELATGGTVFLDEIGELPLAVQGKLLRAIEEKTVDRIGGRMPVPVDVRIVAATNRELQQAAEAGEFRRDLYFRLAVFPVEIPPLRERAGDVVLLARHFAAQFGKELRGREATLTDDALALLGAHAWPGNVRELENAIERACILADTSTLDARDLSLPGARALSGGTTPLPETFDELDLSGGLAEATERAVSFVERRKIAETLRAHDGNKTRAAETLGVSYKTLLTKIKDYDL
ncbi:MAG TPA: sigma-54 dependent transcriptional regulator [Pyrinomonadaceae bacterium]|jgi:DNA-binding NtrC family response regulator|nr:sigma-54 dependent transcriptional regulator [Pyrinomonadaceae bacterium]